MMVELLPKVDLDRTEHLSVVLDEMILKIMINLSQRGYRTEEILDALDTVCERRWQAYEEDPMAVEAPVEAKAAQG